MSQHIYPYTLTWSTFFTLARIALVPFIVKTLNAQAWFAALILFSCAALTDTIDGALARFLNERTLLGAYLDPIADKLLIVSCFCTFSVLNVPELNFPCWFISLTCLKEILLLMGAWYCLKRNPELIRPTFWGKLTMAVQSLSIGLFLIGLLVHGFPLIVFDVLIASMSLLMIIALGHYIYQMVLGLLWVKN
ncbi:MAG: CDP-alcohol phosphatidyltransferase family protein [Candidatus Babeliaceae bacterium]